MYCFLFEYTILSVIFRTDWFENKMEESMATDPLGFIARASAASLLMITPEYWKVRGMRAPGAASVRYEPVSYSIAPEMMTVENLNIRFARSHVPDRPTILFLSPLPQSIYCYEQSWKLLSGDFDLVAIDLPGFGGSEGGMSLMNFSAQSLFLEKLINQLGLKDVHIVAPDVAMPVALHYVLYRNHQAKSILVGDGPGILPSEDGSLIRKIVGSAFWRAIVRVNGARTFLATATEIGYLHYSLTELELRDYVASYQGRVDQVVAYFASYPDGLHEIDFKLDTLTLPVHVFWGDTDAFLSCTNAKTLSDRLQNSEMTVFENCGHFSYQDKPEAFTKMIRDWVMEGHKRFPKLTIV